MEKVVTDLTESIKIDNADDENAISIQPDTEMPTIEDEEADVSKSAAAATVQSSASPEDEKIKCIKFLKALLALFKLKNEFAVVSDLIRALLVSRR